MDAYSRDLRSRILEDYDGGMTTRVAATKYRVSESWLRQLKQRRRETGETTPRSSRPKSAKKALAEHSELLRTLVGKQPDATLKELRAELPIAVSVTTLWRALDELKLSFKKVVHAAEQYRPDVVAERARWQAEMTGLDVERLVFLDETATNMMHLRGRASRGARLVDKTPYGHWKSTTFVSALRSYGLTAPTVVDGALEGPLFLAYVRQQLVPTVRAGDDQRRGASARAERRQLRRRLPMTVRSTIVQARAAQSSTARSRHVRLDPRFVEEHEPFRIEAELLETPCGAAIGHVDAGLLGGDQDFFEREPELMQRAAERRTTERRAEFRTQFIEREVRLLLRRRANPFGFGGPLRRPLPLQRRSDLPLFAPLLLHAPHPRFADFELQRHGLRPQRAVARRQNLTTEFLRVNHRSPPVIA